MEKTPVIKKGKYINKGWGHELHIENNEDYCGKLLVFNKDKKFSMHYHIEKYETWFIQKGKLKFIWIDPQNADIHEDILREGDIVTIYQGISHQLEAIEDSIIFETSTQDKIKDSYRVWKGDSQK
jgi:mannose-6-phosphate isomerase-like protein (cupin superfamily)